MQRRSVACSWATGPGESVAQPAIAFRQVNKWFGKLHVLQDITLEIQPGEVVVVCGPSGSGKSTLIRCVNRLESVQSGEVVVLGQSLTQPSVNLTRLRTEVGMVFQAFNLYPHMTALENILLAPLKVKGLSRAEAEKIAVALLARVGIPEKAGQYPAHLSGGQQQRVAIARALVNEPVLLLADEPTGNLDSRTSVEIMGVFQRLNAQGITILMVTHEPDIARHTTRTIVMRDGLIVADAPVRERLDAAVELRRLPPVQPVGP